MLCDIDGSILCSSKSVYSHNKIPLNDDHHCKICSKTFSTLEFLKKNKKRTHTDAVYQCNECNEQFKVQYNLRLDLVYKDIEAGKFTFLEGQTRDLHEAQKDIYNSGQHEQSNLQKECFPR